MYRDKAEQAVSNIIDRMNAVRGTLSTIGDDPWSTSTMSRKLMDVERERDALAIQNDLLKEKVSRYQYLLGECGVENV